MNVLRSQVEVERAENDLGFVVHVRKNKVRVDEVFITDEEVAEQNPANVDVYHVAQELGLARFNAEQ